jgi:hypothetical protein
MALLNFLHQRILRFLFFCLETKEAKIQACLFSATCYPSIPKLNKLASLKQCLILRNLRNAGARLRSGGLSDITDAPGFNG